MSEEKMFEMLIAEKDRVASDLRSEITHLHERLAEMETKNRQLWGAVAQLQFACGTANEWRNDDDYTANGCEWFDDSIVKADGLLDGVTGLVPAGEKK